MAKLRRRQNDNNFLIWDLIQGLTTDSPFIFACLPIASFLIQDCGTSLELQRKIHKNRL